MIPSELESGQLWRNPDNETLVRVHSYNEEGDVVAFVYKDKDPSMYTTSRALFEMFFEHLSPEEQGMIMLSELE